MIELAALLGAMIVTLGVLITAGQIPDFGVYLSWTFIGAPIFGAIWGALVGAIIHFVASDGMALIISAWALLHHHPH
jgi:hypothetical protein